MEYLVELYDMNGRKVYSWRSADPITALSELAKLCTERKVLLFCDATCFYQGVPQWILEVK